MTGSVVSRSRTLPATLATHTDHAASRSTAGIAWSAPVIKFAELGENVESFAPAAASFAECAVELRGASRSAGQIQQTRLGFRAYPDHIFAVRAERPLVSRSDGRLRPVGQWSVVGVQDLQAKGPTVHQQTIINPGRFDSNVRAVASATVFREFESAVDAEAYLPATVRADMWVAVLEPATFIGELVKHSHPQHPDRQRLTLLRTDGRTAVVVTAVRKDIPTAAWTVDAWRWILISHPGQQGRQLDAA